METVVRDVPARLITYIMACALKTLDPDIKLALQAGEWRGNKPAYE